MRTKPMSRTTRSDVLQAVLWAVVLHAGLMFFIIGGLSWFVRTPQPVPVVEAVIINDVDGRLGAARKKAEAEAAQQAAQKKAEQERLQREQAEAEAAEQARVQRQREEQARAEAEQKAREEAAEQARKAAEEAKRKAAEEAERKRQEEAARKKAEEEAKRKAEEERKRKEAEAKRKAEEEAKRKAEEERKRKAEAERKRREEAERKAREAAEAEARRKALLEALGEEEGSREQAAERSRWIDVVSTKIKNAWLRPPGLPEGLQCKLRVRILPNGEVGEAELAKSSGNRLFDDSAISAVNKASPYDPPPAGQRDAIVFTFDPD